MKNKEVIDTIFQHPLQGWSWGDIQAMYQVLGQLLHNYRLIGDRIDIPKAHINFSDEENIFLLRWHTDIRRIDSQLAALDVEIARRNSLVGVIG